MIYIRMEMNDYHKTVLLKEAIDYLNIDKGKIYVDATLGGGGHAAEIIKRGGIVLGIDGDEEALEFVKENFQFPISNFQLRLAKGNFKDVDKIVRENKIKKISGAIFDLGVSSHQLESAERGFSFMKEGPLDMRMDRDLSVKAEGLINILTEKELVELFEKYGEEGFARLIAKGIVKERKISPIKTTAELVEIVKRVVPKFKTDSNPATKVFQALRIAINDELNSLRESLPKVYELLNNGGRISVITFHSLEDRIIKHQFKDWEDLGLGKVITKKPVTPSEEELRDNRRARSSKLRVFEKNKL
jgi:16S rRNA (cytosine1402-N4)-methyltransferase